LDPSPVWPYSSSPQHAAVPPTITAQEWLAPTAIPLAPLALGELVVALGAGVSAAVVGFAVDPDALAGSMEAGVVDPGVAAAAANGVGGADGGAAAPEQAATMIAVAAASPVIARLAPANVRP
jgi:hypothetical protein